MRMGLGNLKSETPIGEVLDLVSENAFDVDQHSVIVLHERPELGLGHGLIVVVVLLTTMVIVLLVLNEYFQTMNVAKRYMSIQRK